MKKLMNIIKNLITIALVLMAAAMMIFTIVSVSTFDRTDRSLFGYRAFIVLSDSMSRTDFDAGDLVLTKEADPSTLKEGDIISYQSTNEENYGEVVTHKIRTLTADEAGGPGFITYGTTTDTDDEKVVTYSQVIGKYQMSIPKAGKFFQFLKTTPGYILCIFLPFLLLILIQGMNSIKLFRRYRREQLEEIQAEKESLEEERRKSREMMAELLKMKEQLGAGNITNGTDGINDTGSANETDAINDTAGSNGTESVNGTDSSGVTENKESGGREN